MRFFLTIGLTVSLLCGLSYLSISQWQVRQNLTVQINDFEEDTTSETGSEEVELKENIEAIAHVTSYSHIYFKTKLNRTYSHKETWVKHFVDEISTPPPEA
ncbi:MAG: hypothetical protein ACK5AB_00795 [Bacteroidota bacterium]|jgi:hypothetical protein